MLSEWTSRNAIPTNGNPGLEGQGLGDLRALSGGEHDIVVGRVGLTKSSRE